ncbi:glycine-rich protein, partial [Trifolium pratense]
MNSAQVLAFQPGIICVQKYKSHVLPKGIINSLPRIQCIGIRDKPYIRFKSLKPICAGGKGNNDENSPWKSLTNAMEKFKGQSIEEVLQKQIQKGEYFDSGGSGVKPPGGGGDGGSGGSPDGSDDDGYDTRQVIFATIGLISLYIYLIMRQEVERLIPDFIRFIFTGTKSFRLKRIMCIAFPCICFALIARKAVRLLCMNLICFSMNNCTIILIPRGLTGLVSDMSWVVIPASFVR